MPWAAPSLANLAVVPLLAAIASPAPMAYPAFPATPDFTTVARWAALRTDIPPRDLLDVREGFAFVVLPASTIQGARRIRLEAIEPRAWVALGGRSAVVRVQLACAPDSAKPISLDVYAASNRLGEVRRGLDPAALPVSAGAMSVLASVLCSPPLLARPLVAVEEEAPAAPDSERRSDAVDAPRTAGERPVIARRRVIAVQVGAFVSRSIAESALLRLNAARPSLEPRIELSGAAKAPLFRALLIGFATRKEAAAYCADLKRLHRTCLVRGVR